MPTQNEYDKRPVQRTIILDMRAALMRLSAAGEPETAHTKRCDPGINVCQREQGDLCHNPHGDRYPSRWGEALTNQILQVERPWNAQGVRTVLPQMDAAMPSCCVDQQMIFPPLIG